MESTPSRDSDFSSAFGTYSGGAYTNLSLLPWANPNLVARKISFLFPVFLNLRHTTT